MLFTLLGLLLGGPAPGSAAQAAPRDDFVLRAAWANTPISIDGRLDEHAWPDAPTAASFLQRDPNQGEAATEPTELRILFDGHALYVGARLHDREPGAVVRQLSRRDVVAEADSFSLFLDPHHDHRSGVEFQVSAAGVQRDSVIYDDNFEDDSWDAVWESAVTIDEGGWTVEMRIPFSQLRFPEAPGHTWGVNARRLIRSKNEESWLALVPKNESGLASRMAHLEGISGIAPGRHLELVPYASMRAEYVEPAVPGNPWNDGSRLFGGAGLDFKYGVGTGMALVGAINPDFGQVEVDPAVVNLTAFETFFEEKRPFFTEGSQVFLRFGRGGASDYTTFFYPEPLLFYSRRIGRAPQGTAEGAFVDTPASTTILAAAKLVGRTKGWNVGLLDAVTGRENARVSAGLSQDRTLVEPLTNYVVGRAQRELGRRGGLGFLGSAVNRRLHAGGLDSLLVDRAFVAGADGHLFLDERRNWVVSGGLAGSTVSGSPAAVLRLQRASQRYYQRPDAPHVEVDRTATSLSGWSGRVGLNKNSGNVTFGGGLWGINPGFEPNDLGFATQTDRAGGHGMALFRKLTPDRFTRARRLSVAKWWTWNYGRECQGDGVQVTAGAQLRNYWQLEVGMGRSWNTWDDKLTRGGPTTIRPGIRNLAVAVSTDNRWRFWASASSTLQKRDFGSWSQLFGVTLNVKPWAALTVSATPSLLRLHTVAQYLATVPDETATSTFGARYVFGGLDQTEWTFPLRVNLVLSPRLSLQLYVQALLSAGDYPQVKELAAPRTYEFPVYGSDVGTIEKEPGGSTYLIDPDGGGPARSFRLTDPNFNLKSLRANAVVRWEFRPGSAAYLVWTQRRQNQSYPGDSYLGRDASELFHSPADDVFMIKVAWWLGR